MTSADRNPVVDSSTPSRVVAVVLVVGIVLSSIAAVAAWTLNRNNERSLLEVQTKQAAAVLGATILTIADPLHAALQVEEETDGDPAAFQRSLSPITGPSRVFVAASLVDVGGPVPRVIATVGEPTELSPLTGKGRDLVMLARRSTTFVVTTGSNVPVDRIAYAVADPTRQRYVVYAERAIPVSRVVPAENNPAFADLHFATYLGPTTDLAALTTTDVPESELPFGDDSSREAIPFGNTTLTLVTSARTQLGGALGWQLPWVLLVGGIVLSIITAVAAASLVRSRHRAERDRRTITSLYDKLDGLFAEQRTIAQTLQQALLPRYNPTIPNLEIATRYNAGAQGVDIGGDWYSVIAIDDTHVGFVVGDVSGRGVSAAAVMARLRFTMRAYLLEGHPPQTVLSMVSRQLDIVADEHFATVLVGVADTTTREVVLSNAGHLPPLVIAGGTATYVDTAVGPPIGVGGCDYAPTELTMEPGSTLLSFTDGLVERRREVIDVGLERLAAMCLTADAEPLDAWAESLVTGVTNLESEDDVAVLALRWVATPDEPTP